MADTGDRKDGERLPQPAIPLSHLNSAPLPFVYDQHALALFAIS
jgi:hypothetical protein